MANKTIYDIVIKVKPNDFPSESFRNLYMDERTADVYFVCGNQKDRVPAHKDVLSKASDVFRKMFNEEVPGENDEVELPTTSAEVLKNFLHLCYLDEVNFRIENITEVVDLVKKYQLPDHFRFDLKIPQEPKSSKHILNALNDDCIQAVLRKLTNAPDYLHAAEVCIQFQQNAKISLRSKVKALIIRDDKKYANALISTSVKKFVSIFGPSIKSIDWRSSPRKNGNDVNAILNEISNCKQLTELKIDGLDLDFKTVAPFEALKTLVLSHSSISNFGFHPQLFTLSLMEGSYIDNFIQHHPKLENTIILDDFSWLSDTQLIDFLQLNPQTKRLHVISKNISTSIHEHIANIAPNLDGISSVITNTSTEEELMHLSRLRKLTKLYIYFPFGLKLSLIDKLIDSMAEHDFNIEELALMGMFDEIQSKTVVKLKSIRRLTIQFKMSERSLIDIAMKLTKLTYIYCQIYNLTPDGIVDVLMNGRSLQMLEITAPRMVITCYEYEKILGMIRHGRVTVKIRCRECQVTSGQLEDHRKWLNIEICP